MTTSLRDIPGAAGRGPGGRRNRRDPWRGLGAGSRTPVLLDPRQPIGFSGGGRRGPRRNRSFQWRLSAFDTLLLGTCLLVVLFLASALWRATRVDVQATGLERGQALTAEAAEKLQVRLLIAPSSRVGRARLTFDGEPIAAAQRTKRGFRWDNQSPLTPGSHELRLTVPRPVLPASIHRWRFDVDATMPVIKAPGLMRRRGMKDPVRFTGSVDTDAKLTANDEPVDLDRHGRFSLSYDTPPAGGVMLVASDAAGHETKHHVAVPIRRPRVRAVHVSAAGWATHEIRAGVLRLIDQGKINAVELDVKDEAGETGYLSKVALARQVGAAKPYYDLENAVKDLHGRGVRVIARIVAFRDPLLAHWAWANGHRDWVVQTPEGKPQGAYGGFTNFASEDVLAYNLAIAKEAVDAGVDEVLWDYMRRPEGALASMRFPGLVAMGLTPEEAVATFLGRSQAMLRARGVYQGASVFGIAAKQPQEIAQNVPMISRYVDYLAPMVYPSLWTAGEYTVDDPTRQPFDIVSRSLDEFKNQSKPFGIYLTPWLQDFSLGMAYDDTQVWQQIRGAQHVGIQDWMLWSPRVRYHTAMLGKVDAERF